MITEIKGIIQNRSPFYISEHNLSGYGGGVIYPTGRQIRGAIGYIALDLNLSVAEKFTDFSWDEVIFRDALPVCKCGKIFIPDINGDFQQCKNCLEFYNKTLLLKAQTPDYSFSYITDGKLFRLSIIIKDEKYKKDIDAITDYIYDNGFYLGGKISKGYGYFRVRELEIHQAKIVKSEKIKLLSDAIISSPPSNIQLKTITFSKTTQSNNNFELIQEKAISRGKTLIDRNHNGLYIGKYGGLGFGEIIAI